MGQVVSRLQIGCGAQRITFLAVPALFGSNFGNETNLFSHTAVDKPHSVFLLDPGTISDAQATVDAKRGFFFKTVLVGT